MFRQLRFGKPVAVLCALAAMTAALTYTVLTLAADGTAHPKITANVDVAPLATLTRQEDQAVSLAAGQILHHVERARLAIADKKREDAVKQIDQGLKLVRIVNNAAPKRKVVTDIKSGDVAYHDEELAAQRYVKVFGEQYVEDIVTPVVQAKKDGGAAKSGDKKRDSAKASKGKSGAETGAPIEDFSVWRQMDMKLDVVAAKRMLEEAKRDLKDGKNAEATACLSAIQTRDVTFETAVVELPLVEAARNLKLAQLQMQQGRHEDALAALKLASDDLKEYEGIAGQSRAKEVRALHGEIDKLTKALEGEKDLEKAMKKAEKAAASWWERAVKWLKG